MEMNLNETEFTVSHGNECPMRHVFCECDGGYGTTGPKSFKSPIGQSLTSEDHHLKEITFHPYQISKFATSTQ